MRARLARLLARLLLLDPPTVTFVLSLDDLVVGEWCPTCALPSGVSGAAPYAVNGRPAGVVSGCVCVQCGAQVAVGS